MWEFFYACRLFSAVFLFLSDILKDVFLKKKRCSRFTFVWVQIHMYFCISTKLKTCDSRLMARVRVRQTPDVSFVHVRQSKLIFVISSFGAVVGIVNMLQHEKVGGVCARKSIKHNTHYQKQVENRTSTK